MSYLLIITFLLTPTYSLRFNIGSLPTNLLMALVVFVWVGFLAFLFLNNKWKEFLEFILGIDKKVLIITLLFFCTGFVSLFVGGISQNKIGQFVVLFFQPISLFFIAIFVFQKNPGSKNLLLTAVYLLLAAIGIYSIFQYFTLIGLPAQYWGNNVEPKRALGFFAHPNFYALFSAPLLALLIPDLLGSIKDKGLRIKDTRLWAWFLGAAGLFLSLSRAGWIALAAAAAVYILVAGDKKIRKIALGIAMAMFLVIVSVPNLRYRLLLPFYGEKSAVSRFSLWETGLKGVKESPVIGLGLTGFSNNWVRLNTDPNIDNHNFPHNIFLNLWVETGLLGLVSFVGLCALLIYRGLKNKHDAIKLGVALFLIALLLQGQIDNPYLKNDLALVFWLVLALYF
jgi:putative inorganic carbon (HCO3(-)) transporter